MEKRFGMHFLKRTWVLFWRGRSWNVCVQKFLTFSDPLRAWYDWLICCSFFEMAKPSHNMPCNLPKFSLPNGTFSICPIFISAMIYASNQRLLCNSATMSSIFLKEHSYFCGPVFWIQYRQPPYSFGQILFHIVI